MAIDGKILARAKGALSEKRRRHEDAYKQRLETVYAVAPGVRLLDTQIRNTMMELVGVALDPGSGVLPEDIRRENLALQEQRRGELLRAGFKADYLDDGYMCVKCHDTGYFGTDICDCLKRLYKEAQKESLSSLFKLGRETFSNFNLGYYDDRKSPETGVSPRISMGIVYEYCVEYARKFGKKSNNLFMSGAPGLGKTFLSACIARVVSEKNYSVVYDTATSIFTKFEDAKFMRNTDDEDRRKTADEAIAEVKRFLECDLLIFDDLGTEMTTAPRKEALYELVNTRLVTDKKTIMSSNLTFPELRERYSEQIMSRLEGDYQVLTFCGEDIRKKKNVV